MSDTVDTVDTQDRNTRGRSWCLTINNFTEADIAAVEKIPQHVIGKEHLTQGTPHLQCVIRYTNPTSFNKVKKDFPTAHIEPCKNWKASVNYCKKDGDFIDKEKSEYKSQIDARFNRNYKNVIWKPWQKDVVDLLKTTPDDRTIHWYWEETGNVGKSFLSWYIAYSYKCIIANGKQADIFNQVKTFVELKQVSPLLVLCDIPRVCEDYVCYTSLEKMKDGLLYSGKYEGGVVLLDSLHILCFANFKPKKNKLSEDRWHIVEIV